MTTYELMIPFEDGKTAAQLYEIGTVEIKRPMESGTFFRFKTVPEFAKKLNLDRYKI